MEARSDHLTVSTPAVPNRLYGRVMPDFQLPIRLYEQLTVILMYLSY